MTVSQCSVEYDGLILSSGAGFRLESVLKFDCNLPKLQHGAHLARKLNAWIVMHVSCNCETAFVMLFCSLSFCIGQCPMADCLVQQTKAQQGSRMLSIQKPDRQLFERISLQASLSATEMLLQES